MQIIEAAAIRAAVTTRDALDSAKIAFGAFGRGAATVPPPQSLRIPDRNGELHIKCGYIHGSRFFVAKAATGFYDNASHGLPSGSGLMLVFDATTGFPLALLEDNGYLTEMRTAAAGTLATQLLAIKDFKHVALIGAGAQARFHLRAFQDAFRWTSTSVWSRAPEKARALCEELRSEISCEFREAASPEAAVRDADVIITVTPSHSALVQGEWLTPHATVIAVGSDEPHKRELDAEVFRRAGRVVADSLAQCATRGELHHAFEDGAARFEDVTELGEVVTGRKIGRVGNELIVCDLTGIGVQDAAIAEAAFRRLAIGETAAQQL